MSQHPSWQQVHAVRPGIIFDIKSGHHINLADDEIQQLRFARFGRLMIELQKKDFEIDKINFSSVIGLDTPEQYVD